MALGGVMAVMSGCASFDPQTARRDQTDAFTTSLDQMSSSLLSKPLSLDACVRIAMTNNYEVRTAELNRRLGKLARNLSFTAFLPQVAATAGYTSYAKEPMMQEKRAYNGSVDVGLPIFMPSSWFLYAAAKHGQASTDIAAAYVRQGIVLQTTSDYFDLMVQQEMVAALKTQTDSAKEAASRITGLAGEGFFTDWERDQAVYLAEAREAEWNHARRQLDVVRGNLLIGIGLSPMADLELSGDIGTASRPEGDVTNLVIRALEIHPELSLADRLVVISEDNVRKAFCNFIPTVSLASSLTWTTDDLAKHSANWMAGISGVWDIFSGFANVARYQQAKIERERSELERETTFLSIIIRVVAAEAAVKDAEENARLAQRAYGVAQAKFEAYSAKLKEGLLPLSEALDARSEMEQAQVALLQGKYQVRIAIANLELAMGITAIAN